MKLNGYRRPALIALACVAAISPAALPGAAVAKKKGKSIAGKYAGLTEENGTVSFKLTRSGRVLDFTLTNATLYCVVEPSNVNITYFPDYTRVITITHAPMTMEKKTPNKNPQGKRFEVDDPIYEDRAHDGSYIKGAIASLTKGSRVVGTGFGGEVVYGSSSGPMHSPGTENCVTKFIDWEAKPPGSKGLVSVGGSGHMRPPLSEFSFRW
jgi:hypothetical protein